VLAGKLQGKNMKKYLFFASLKGLSNEIDFENVDED
jgi:hypothetical protein